MKEKLEAVIKKCLEDNGYFVRMVEVPEVEGKSIIDITIRARLC